MDGGDVAGGDERGSDGVAGGRGDAGTAGEGAAGRGLGGDEAGGGLGDGEGKVGEDVVEQYRRRAGRAGEHHGCEVGVVVDDDFGPVMLVGPGGTSVELFDDAFAYRALPVTEADAREMLAESAAGRLLTGRRGAPAPDRDAVVATLVAVADVATTHDVAELELNPLVATPDGAVAVDLLVEDSS